MKTQGEDGHLQARREAWNRSFPHSLRENKSYQHLISGWFKSLSLWSFVMAPLETYTVAGKGWMRVLRVWGEGERLPGGQGGGMSVPFITCRGDLGDPALGWVLTHSALGQAPSLLGLRAPCVP